MVYRNMSKAIAMSIVAAFAFMADAQETTNKAGLADTFKLFPDATLEGSELDETCHKVVSQSIPCDAYVGQLGRRQYHGSLEDVALTESICSAPCKNGLTTARRRIAGACASTPDLLPGYPILSVVDSILSGWNETCLKDKDTDKYCNDIIESWEGDEGEQELSHEQLCSYCYGTKLRMMQASPYSAYDDLFAQTLQAVNKECGVESATTPTTQTGSPLAVNASEPALCVSGQGYTTLKDDSCDKIALKNSVSAASLYYINPALTNCSNVPQGLHLCLPDKCDAVYEVQENDSCVSVGVDAGHSWMSLVDWNLGLDARCSNLWSNNPFWGRVVCISPPGGQGEPTGPGSKAALPGNGRTGGAGGSGDGYSDTIVAPPEGTLAEGTTKECGHYVQARGDSGCSGMIATEAVPMDIFLEANPALGTAAECDDRLVSGVWYCLRPHRGWNSTVNAA